MLCFGAAAAAVSAVVSASVASLDGVTDAVVHTSRSAGCVATAEPSMTVTDVGGRRTSTSRVAAADGAGGTHPDPTVTIESAAAQ
jgi:hypothetical protein